MHDAVDCAQTKFISRSSGQELTNVERVCGWHRQISGLTLRGQHGAYLFGRARDSGSGQCGCAAISHQRRWAD